MGACTQRIYEGWKTVGLVIPIEQSRERHSPTTYGRTAILTTEVVQNSHNKIPRIYQRNNIIIILFVEMDKLFFQSVEDDIDDAS